MHQSVPAAAPAAPPADLASSPAPLPRFVNRAAPRPVARPEDVAPRRCLACGERFLSAHVGNRICLVCKTANLHGEWGQ